MAHHTESERAGLHRSSATSSGAAAKQTRYVFAVKGEAALERWLSWGRRCRIPAFVNLAKRIAAVRLRIDQTSSTACPTR